MRDTARLAAMDVPDDNPAFRRGWTWDAPDRLPHQKPRHGNHRTLDQIAAELAISTKAA